MSATSPPSSKLRDLRTNSSHTSICVGGLQATDQAFDRSPMSRYRRAESGLRITSQALLVLSLVASLGITTCSSLSMSGYRKAQPPTAWIMPLWPLALDLRPSRLMIACGTIVLFLHTAQVGLAFVARRCSAIEALHDSVSHFTSILSFLLAIITALFVGITTNRLVDSVSEGTLISWTCRWQIYAADPLTQSSIPANFNAICNNGNAAYDLIIALVIFEFLAIVTNTMQARLRRKTSAHVRQAAEKWELH